MTARRRGRRLTVTRVAAAPGGDRAARTARPGQLPLARDRLPAPLGRMPPGSPSARPGVYRGRAERARRAGGARPHRPSRSAPRRSCSEVTPARRRRRRGPRAGPGRRLRELVRRLGRPPARRPTTRTRARHRAFEGGTISPRRGPAALVLDNIDGERRQHPRPARPPGARDLRLRQLPRRLPADHVQPAPGAAATPARLGEDARDRGLGRPQGRHARRWCASSSRPAASTASSTT